MALLLETDTDHDHEIEIESIVPDQETGIVNVRILGRGVEVDHVTGKVGKVIQMIEVVAGHEIEELVLSHMTGGLAQRREDDNLISNLTAKLFSTIIKYNYI